jgi:transposase-like protein
MPIEFPIVELLSSQSSYDWLLEHFHPDGLKCPGCGAGLAQARRFRKGRVSGVQDYRCRVCNKTYNAYSGTVFERGRLRPEQAVLLVRGIIKGEQAQVLANEIGVCRQTVQALRMKLQANAQALQPDNPLQADEITETDELYQNAGEKR